MQLSRECAEETRSIGSNMILSDKRLPVMLQGYAMLRNSGAMLRIPANDNHSTV